MQETHAKGKENRQGKKFNYGENSFISPNKKIGGI
jgi:hypothetical protein